MRKTANERQVTWRKKIKTYKEWKAHILAQWQEHNVFHYIKQPDGGIRILLEHNPEGDQTTAEIAELCGLNSDTVIKQMVGEILSGTGGVWIPAKLKGS